MMRASLASCALACAACSRPALFVSTNDVPLDVRWLALLFEDAAGTPVGSTRLIEGRASKEAFEIIPTEWLDSSAVRVVGYSEADLARIELPDPAKLRDSKVTRASAGDPRLPQPSFHRRGPISGGRVRLDPVPASETVDLTAAWLPRCRTGEHPTLDAAAVYQCETYQCAGRAHVEECRLDLDLGDCLLSPTNGDFDGAGGIHFVEPSPLDCTAAAERRQGAAISVRCGDTDLSCDLDVYPAPFVVHASSDEVELWRAEGTIDDNPDEYGQARLLTAIAAIPDRVAVIAPSFGSGLVMEDCQRGNSLVFIDPETLAVTSTAAAPPCTRVLSADPQRRGFIALYHDGGPKIGLLAADGTIHQTVPVALRAETLEAHAKHLVIEPGEGWLAINVATFDGGGGREPAYVAFHEYPGLDPIGTSDLLVQDVPPNAGQKPVGIASLGGRKVIVADDDTSELFEVEVGAGRKPAQVERIADFSAARSPLVAVAFHAATQRILMSRCCSLPERAAVPAVIAVRRGATTVRTASVWELEAGPYALAEWPPDPDLIAVGLTLLDRERSAGLALLDPAGPRFLPGLLRFAGRGPVTRIAADDRGRLWLLLGHSATVVRVTPR